MQHSSSFFNSNPSLQFTQFSQSKRSYIPPYKDLVFKKSSFLPVLLSSPTPQLQILTNNDERLQKHRAVPITPDAMGVVHALVRNIFAGAEQQESIEQLASMPLDDVKVFLLNLAMDALKSLFLSFQKIQFICRQHPLPNQATLQMITIQQLVCDVLSFRMHYDCQDEALPSLEQAQQQIDRFQQYLDQKPGGEPLHFEQQKSLESKEESKASEETFEAKEEKEEQKKGGSFEEYLSGFNDQQTQIKLMQDKIHSMESKLVNLHSQSNKSVSCQHNSKGLLWQSNLNSNLQSQEVHTKQSPIKQVLNFEMLETVEDVRHQQLTKEFVFKLFIILKTKKQLCIREAFNLVNRHSRHKGACSAQCQALLSTLHSAMHRAEALHKKAFFKKGKALRQRWHRTLNNVKFVRIVLGAVQKRVFKGYLGHAVQQIKRHHAASIRQDKARLALALKAKQQALQSLFSCLDKANKALQKDFFIQNACLKQLFLRNVKYIAKMKLNVTAVQESFSLRAKKDFFSQLQLIVQAFRKVERAKEMRMQKRNLCLRESVSKVQSVFWVHHLQFSFFLLRQNHLAKKEQAARLHRLLTKVNSLIKSKTRLLFTLFLYSMKQHVSQKQFQLFVSRQNAQMNAKMSLKLLDSLHKKIVIKSQKRLFMRLKEGLAQKKAMLLKQKRVRRLGSLMKKQLFYKYFLKMIKCTFFRKRFSQGLNRFSLLHSNRVYSFLRLALGKIKQFVELQKYDQQISKELSLIERQRKEQYQKIQGQLMENKKKQQYAKVILLLQRSVQERQLKALQRLQMWLKRFKKNQVNISAGVIKLQRYVTVFRIKRTNYMFKCLINNYLSFKKAQRQKQVQAKIRLQTFHLILNKVQRRDRQQKIKAFFLLLKSILQNQKLKKQIAFRQDPVQQYLKEVQLKKAVPVTKQNKSIKNLKNIQLEFNKMGIHEELSTIRRRSIIDISPCQRKEFGEGQDPFEEAQKQHFQQMKHNRRNQHLAESQKQKLQLNQQDSKYLQEVQELQNVMQMIEYNQNLEISGPFEIATVEQRRQKQSILNTIEDQTHRSTDQIINHEEKETKLQKQKSEVCMHRKTSSVDRLPREKNSYVMEKEEKKEEKKEMARKQLLDQKATHHLAQKILSNGLLMKQRKQDLKGTIYQKVLENSKFRMKQ